MATDARPKTLAVTALDRWRRWVEDDGDEHHEAPTLEDFRRELLSREQSPKMLVGTAGHKVLEGLAARDLTGIEILTVTRGFGYGDHYDDGVLDFQAPAAFDGEIEAGGYTHVTVTGNDGLPHRFELRWELPNDEAIVVMPLRESKVALEVNTSIGPVTVRGRIDGGDGVEVLDYKFTGRPDLEELDRSWQWKVYLLATGAQRIRYEVFRVRLPLRDAPDVWRITDRQTYRQYAYPGMREDVERAVDEFARLIDRDVPEYWDRSSARASVEAMEVD